MFSDEEHQEILSTLFPGLSEALKLPTITITLPAIPSIRMWDWNDDAMEGTLVECASSAYAVECRVQVRDPALRVRVPSMTIRRHFQSLEDDVDDREAELLYPELHALKSSPPAGKPSWEDYRRALQFEAPPETAESREIREYLKRASDAYVDKLIFECFRRSSGAVQHTAEKEEDE